MNIDGFSIDLVAEVSGMTEAEVLHEAKYFHPIEIMISGINRRKQKHHEHTEPTK